MNLGRAQLQLRRLIRRHRATSVLGVGLLSLVVTVCLGLSFFPVPSNMDEFSTLLGADTLAHGRLTNPTPPAYRHFETLHVLVQPTYNSKYVPGAALMLAFGQRVFGHPVAGLWIATALSCGALTWMFMAWMPAEWAVLGGVLAIFYPLTSQWARFYLCCNLAVLGGALILGAFRRLIRKPNFACSLIFGLGISVVALMRPYEGAILSALVVAWLFIESWRSGLWFTVRKSLLPSLLVVLAALSFLGYYNWRVTGRVLSLPYAVYAKEYSTAPVFWFVKETPWVAPARYAPERYSWATDFNDWELGTYRVQRTLHGFLGYLVSVKLKLLWYRYNSVALLGFLGLPLALRHRMNRRAAVLYLLWFAPLLLICWLNHNYTAPAFALFFLLLLQSMRALAGWRMRGLPAGAAVVAFSVVACIALRFTVIEPRPTYEVPYGDDRASLIAKLQSTPGQHLVLVRYGPQHPIAAEWIYNDADIEHSRIIWARDLGPAANRELFEHFHDRHVWLLQPDESARHLQPYTDDMETPPARAKDLLITQR